MFTGPGLTLYQEATGPGPGLTLTTEQPVSAQDPAPKAFGPGSTYFTGTPKFVEN